MSDDVKAAEPETITLIAVERGFAMGKLVEPGTKFLFAKFDKAGKERNLPKWAALSVKDVPPKKAWNGDLRPVDAQKASKNKTGELKAAA